MSGNDNSTKILLHLNGANAATDILDNNAGGSAHAWTNHTGSIATAQSRFGGSSYNCGSAGYVDSPDSADFTLGSSDFAIDTWLYRSGGDGGERIFAGQCDSGLADRVFFAELSSSNKFGCGVSTDGTTWAATITGVSTLVAVGWHHFRMARAGTRLRMFVDGIQEGGDQAIVGSLWDSASAFAVGRCGGYTDVITWNGFIQEFRLTVGVAGEVSNSAPPIAPYDVRPDQTKRLLMV